MLATALSNMIRPLGVWMPAGVPQINRSHPLYPRLRNAIVFDGVSMRDVRGRLGVSSVGAGTPAHGMGQVGHYLQLPVARVAMQGTVGLVGGQALSVVLLCVRTASPDTGSEFRKVGRIVGTSNNYAGFYIDLGNVYGSANDLYCGQNVYSGSPSGASAVFLNGQKISGTGALTGMNKRPLCIGATYSTVVTGDGNVTFGQWPNGSYGVVDSGVVACLFFDALPDAAMLDLTRDPGQMFLRPSLRLRRGVRGASAVSVSLTGIGLTSSSGTIASAIEYVASGSAATASSGSVAPALGLSAAGSAATASAGTPVSAIGVAVTGSAMTVSAGSLAYSIGFTLTGVSSATAGGTLAPSGGDTETERALTGISMSALPGNVRVTGGTRWRPSEAQAVTPPSMVGNTLQPPPRLVGDPASDNRAIQQWLQTLYDHVIKRDNVLGRIADHETRIAAIEATDDTGST